MLRKRERDIIEEIRAEFGDAEADSFLEEVYLANQRLYGPTRSQRFRSLLKRHWQMFMRDCGGSRFIAGAYLLFLLCIVYFVFRLFYLTVFGI